MMTNNAHAKGSDKPGEKKQFVFFYYYIPTVVDTTTGIKRGAYPNPSNELRRYAVRVDDGGSVWYLPLHRIPNHMIAEMREAKCVANTVTFALEEYDNVIAQARGAMDAECQRIGKLVKDGLDEFEVKLVKANKEQSVKGVNAAIAYARGKFNLAKRHAAAATECLVEFDLLREKESIFDALKKKIASQMEEFIGEHVEEQQKRRVEEKAKAKGKKPAAAKGAK